MENPVKETVTVDQIESKLLSIWDSLAKDKKTRARLFNLIVYTKLNDRIDYFRESVQKIIENYPETDWAKEAKQRILKIKQQ